MIAWQDNNGTPLPEPAYGKRVREISATLEPYPTRVRFVSDERGGWWIAEASLISVNQAAPVDLRLPLKRVLDAAGCDWVRD